MNRGEHVFSLIRKIRNKFQNNYNTRLKASPLQMAFGLNLYDILARVKDLISKDINPKKILQRKR